jgi:lipid A 3-O-deacylase
MPSDGSLRVRSAVAAAAAAVYWAFAAPAGASIYDMTRLLYEAHPFDVPSTGPMRAPAPVISQSGTGIYAPASAAPQPVETVRSAPPEPSGIPDFHLLSEVRAGISLHNVGPFARNVEDGQDIDFELLFASPDFLSLLFSPHPHVGVHINTVGDTSQLWAGLAWQRDFWDRIFLEFTFGLAVHDGKLNDPTGRNREFGSRVLFRESIAIGVLFGRDNRHNISIYLDHVSHGGLFDDRNDGMDNTGIRYGYRF